MIDLMKCFDGSLKVLEMTANSSIGTKETNIFEEMTEDDKRKLFYAEVLLKSVSGDDPTWLALEPCMWPMLKEALSDYISKIKEIGEKR